MIKHLVAIVDPHYDVLMTFGGASKMRHMDEGHSGFFFSLIYLDQAMAARCTHVDLSFIDTDKFE